MALTGTRTYVGFGFGAVQAGLFLYEAFQAGAFRRLVVAEVLPEVVQAVRQAGDYFALNIAQADRVEQAVVGPIELENPAQAAGRRRLIEAIAEAEEIGTAVPSVAAYVSAGPGSLHRILAEGLRRKVARNGPRAVVYTAENHNHAAEILETHVLKAIPAEERDRVRNRARFLNTVIGKMSGVTTDPTEIEANKLAPLAPSIHRAFLVEAFNHILISHIQFPDKTPPFQRGLAIFEERADLLPFEEAKLYGHNALHALAAYLGLIRGARFMADLQTIPDLLSFVRAAVVEEAGDALVCKYAGADDLFTESGYQGYVDDLLRRMTNPYLRDALARVGRDPQRKLGWDDRLIGPMRLALAAGVAPRRFAFGAAAALAALEPASLKTDAAGSTARLKTLWAGSETDESEVETILALIETGRNRLNNWIASDFLIINS